MAGKRIRSWVRVIGCGLGLTQLLACGAGVDIEPPVETDASEPSGPGSAASSSPTGASPSELSAPTATLSSPDRPEPTAAPSPTLPVSSPAPTSEPTSISPTSTSLPAPTEPDDLTEPGPTISSTTPGQPSAGGMGGEAGGGDEPVGGGGNGGGGGVEDTGPVLIEPPAGCEPHRVLPNTNFELTSAEIGEAIMVTIDVSAYVAGFEYGELMVSKDRPDDAWPSEHTWLDPRGRIVIDVTPPDEIPKVKSVRFVVIQQDGCPLLAVPAQFYVD